MRNTKERSNEYNNEDDDDENSYLVMPQTPCCEKFFAIAI
jgi:hypothetical protein